MRAAIEDKSQLDLPKVFLFQGTSKHTTRVEAYIVRYSTVVSYGLEFNIALGWLLRLLLLCQPGLPLAARFRPESGQASVVLLVGQRMPIPSIQQR
jgi:hypothetical protein